MRVVVRRQVQEEFMSNITSNIRSTRMCGAGHAVRLSQLARWLLLLGLGRWQCAAWDDPQVGEQAPGRASTVDTRRAAFSAAGASASQHWHVTILSPFSYEPLEREEVKVSVDVSALPFPCSIEVRLNGHRVASDTLEHKPHAHNATWIWHPEEHILRELEGFNGLEVVARQAVCAKDAG
jgi:hypothetical protein